MSYFSVTQDSVEDIQCEMRKAKIPPQNACENVEEKTYTAQQFKAGDFYSYLTENDRIQAAEKYWLAAVQAVKHLFLKIKWLRVPTGLAKH